LPELAPRQRIDAHRRLVEQQQLGRSHQCAGEAELLLHAARELAGRAIGEAGEVGHRQQPLVALAAFLARYAVQVGVEVEVLLHAQVLVQAESLRHVADPVLDLLRGAGDVDAEHVQRPAAELDQAAGGTDQRRLAGAVGADEGGQRAARDLEGDAVERDDRLLRLLDDEALAEVGALDGDIVGDGHGDVRLARCGSCGYDFGGGADAAPARVSMWTVAGMPSRSVSFGSSTKTRIS
jgi:hypothetical protein